jgi:uncharacterized protein YbaP (TraB family)
LAAQAPAATKKDGAPGGRHFVWRISNGAAPVYLIGSLHALRSSDFPLPPFIDETIEASRRVLFELDPGAKDVVLLDKKLVEAGTYSGHVTIEQKVNPKTFAYLKQIAEVRLSEYERRKPWAVAYFMLSNPDASEFKNRLSVERYIYNKVRGRATLGGLETTGEFVSSLSNLSDASSEAFLLETIGYARRFPQLLIDTGEAWRRGDTAAMYRLYAPRRRPSGYWDWLERRQVTWLPRIEEAVRSGKPTVIVAGALHFCGPRSLPAMLRARGYRVEQL